MPNKVYAEVVESQNTRRLLSLSTWSVGACLLIFLVWSMLTSVDEIAKAKGAVIPQGETQVIQSDIGGKLKAIYVKEGDLVLKGSKIVEFDSTFQQTALEELKAKQAALQLSIESDTALIEERQPNFTAFKKRYSSMVTQQLSQYEAQKVLFFQKKAVLEKESAQLSEQLQNTIESIPSYKRQFTATQQQLTILGKGLKSGNISKLRVLEMRQKLASIEQELNDAQGQSDVLKKQLDVNNQKINQLLAETKVEISKSRTQDVTDLEALQAQLDSGEAKLSNTLLLSPLIGLIQSLPSTKMGGVIQPGGTVVEIVPVEGRVSFKAQLSPKDIGFVSIGQSARIKVDAFDYSRFGALKGKVSRISPTTSQDQRGNIYYEVHVKVERTYYRNDPEKFSILPGMTGEVDITTGQKSVFQYLWKPIYTNVSKAFAER